MENILDNIEEAPPLTDKDIFTQIWSSPRKIFKFINDNHYDKYVTGLLFFSGISAAFDRASLKNLGDTLPLWKVMGFCILLGGLLGWITIYLYSALISWTGKWLKGQGNTKSILRIFSYAMLPSILAMVFLIPQIVIYGNEVFKSDGDITSAGWAYNIIVYSSMFFDFVLAIWTVVFCVVGLSEVQKLSIGKSILNMVLPALVILGPIVILVLLFKFVF